jgi:two-component system sensor histidine kinase UhpB
MPDASPPHALTALGSEIARISAENARLLDRLADSERRFRIITTGVLRVQEAERGRIARDLHDSVGQSLTALKIQLEVLLQEAGGRTDGLAARLASLTDLADRTLHEVRLLSHRLRPPMLDDLGLVPTLRWLARSFGARLPVEIVAGGLDGEMRLDPDLETLLYRVAQEALSNAARHAQASSALVRLERNAGRIRLCITDTGRGFDVAAVQHQPAAGSGFGLSGMRDRVRLFGGRFAVRSRPGEGTAIEVDLPVGTEPLPG